MKDTNDGIQAIENEIESLSLAIKKLRGSRLNDRALICLIYDALPSTGRYPATKPCGKTGIKAVLDTALNLKDFYFKKASELKKFAEDKKHGE